MCLAIGLRVYLRSLIGVLLLSNDLFFVRKVDFIHSSLIGVRTTHLCTNLLNWSGCATCNQELVESKFVSRAQITFTYTQPFVLFLSAERFLMSTQTGDFGVSPAV